MSAADKLHNARAILRDYRAHGDELFDRFDPEAGKTGVIGYYRGLVDAFQRAGHHPLLIQELDAVVSQIEVIATFKGVWPLPLAEAPPN
ncbi:MAG: hypothetical protein GEU99_26410 [Luteitalea sp.]|nr:hypothetical protein [Luteitalea sp.]